VCGKVVIEGLGSLPGAPVRRALDLDEGAEFSQAELDSARQAVLDLGVFSSVDIIPDLTGSEKGPTVVPVHVKVEPSKLHASENRRMLVHCSSEELHRRAITP
jgi:outer membrane translocation and assembly module TamA